MGDNKSEEVFFPRRLISTTVVEQNQVASTPLQTLLTGSIGFSVQASHLALAKSSSLQAYVQTESGRQKLKQSNAQNKTEQAPAQGPFDLNVPGTLKVTGQLNGGAVVSVPPGYSGGASIREKGKKGEGPSKSPQVSGSLDKGRFSFTIPLALGSIPQISYANRAAEVLSSNDIPEELAVRPGDKVHIAFPYFSEGDFYDEKKDNRVPRWHTFSYSLGSHVFLDMMDSSFGETKSSAFVGEKVYLRVVSAGHDLTDARDEVKVIIKSESGNSSPFTLKETDQYSGIFKGIFALTYLTDPVKKGQDGRALELPPVELNGFPVLYNDTLTVSWAAGGEDAPPPVSLTINSGSDGVVEPFSKNFSDGSMALKTSFTLAECFFELAKKHKEESKETEDKEAKQKGESLARRQMQHAEKLLMEALASHRDEEQQAHAEYLLGNLAEEYASMSQNDMSKKNSYSDALARYKKVVTDYPEASFASKAQYKVAWVYDKMSEMEGMDTMETAVEEYVKLAYKYPEDELIPKVMARIGQYFVNRGKKFKDEAEEYEKTHGAGSGDGILRKAHLEYLKSAQVYEKLSDRFPSDPLAPVAGLAAAMNYMRADFFNKAVENFEPIIANEELDGDNVRAQALYWTGICYEKGANPEKIRIFNGRVSAVQFYNRTRYEYPSSVWAKYARGRLADPANADAVKIEEERKERIRNSFEKR